MLDWPQVPAALPFQSGNPYTCTFWPVWIKENIASNDKKVLPDRERASFGLGSQALVMRRGRIETLHVRLVARLPAPDSDCGPRGRAKVEWAAEIEATF